MPRQQLVAEVLAACGSCFVKICSHLIYNQHMGDSIERVIEGHCLYLARKFGNPSTVLKSFVDRLKNNREAARSEAVIFAWLDQLGKNPSINESVSAGGTDFRCRPTVGREFLAEVTAFGTDALTSASQLSTDPSNLSGRAFGMVTPQLRRRVGRKMDQMSSGKQLPRVLVVTSEHSQVCSVFNRTGATNLLVSDWSLCTTLSDPPAESCFTSLKDSVFLRWDNANGGSVVPCRRGASAVLLACILRDGVRAVGIVHPAPAARFDLNSLYEVPLLTLSSWRPTDGTLKPTWTMPCDPPLVEHRRLRFRPA